MGNYLYGAATMLCLTGTVSMINENTPHSVWYYATDFAEYLASMI